MKAATYEEARRPPQTGSLQLFWQLLRLDAARRSLRWSVPFALAVGLLIRIGAGESLTGWDQLPFYQHHGHFVPLYAQLWLAILFAVIIAHFNSRCSSLSLGLPVPSGPLWISRIVAVAGAGLIPIAIVVAATTFADPADTAGIYVPFSTIGARTGAGFVLAVVLFQIPSPGVYRISGKKSYVLYVSVMSFAIVMYTILSPGSWVFTALPLAVAVMLVAVLWHRLPGGFKLANIEPDARRRRTDAPGAPAAAWREGSRPFPRVRLVFVICRELFNSWAAWLMLLLIFVTLWSFVRWYFRVLHPLHDLISLTLWNWVFLGQAVRRLKRIDYLPVSRTVVFAVAVAALTIAAGGGSFVGYMQHRLDDDPMTAVCYCDKTIRVPYDAWEVAWDGNAPEVTSPWGESYTPYPARLAKYGTKAAMYNPFEIGKKSSPEFIAMQIDHAVERVHGPDAVSPSAATLTQDSTFIAAKEGGTFPVPASLRKYSDLRTRTNAVIIMLWWIVFAALNLYWWRRYGPKAEIKQTRWFAILFFGIQFGSMIGLVVLDAKGIINDWSLRAFEMVALRSISEAIPLGTGSLYVMTAVVVAVCLVLLAKQFNKVEVPTQRSGKHLLSEY
jgi:hypothetical protein